ncbi:MAG: acetyl-CoA carboxylase biotin carboxyl carrier protein subunit [Draconibacterium sp.]|nr:MAG: acetyl-CoA carboxylase biotin carboxyl carrier protein subunit [Draconibacterium sp.]
MKKYKFIISGNEYEVHLKDIEENIAELDVNGTTYHVEIKSEVKTSKTPKLIRKPVEIMPGEGQIKKSENTGKKRILAPLPGTILKINVSVGDKVVEGQNLLTMEAMKMENQVQTDKAGEVLSINVKPGDAVLQDDLLVEIG